MKHKLVSGPLGRKMREETARFLDKLLPTLPTERQRMKRKAALPTSIDLAAGERAEVSTISTATIDREQEIILPDGLDFSQFELNPCVLMSHNYDLAPVGKCQWVKRFDQGYRAKTHYPRRPENYEGHWAPDEIFALIQAEVLRGKSIGFLELDSRPPSSEEKAKGWAPALNVITSALVLEYSVCTVPMNQDALVEVVSKGLALSPELLAELGFKSPAQPKRKDILPELVQRIAKLNLDAESIVNQAVANLKSRGRI